MGRLRGVQKKEARLWGYYYDAVTKANYTFMVPAEDAPVSGEIVVGPALERSRGLAQGNGISFRSYTGKLHTFIVANVLPQATELVSADLVLMSEENFRAFFDYPADHYTDIALTVANPQEVKNVAVKLAAALPDARPILRDEVLRTYSSIFDWREGIVLALLSAAILAFGILAWEKASGLSAEEKREIGILKAIGWETGDVIKMKFWEGLLISVTAFLAGFVAAYVHVFHFAAALFEAVLKGWAVLYPRFQLAPHIDGVQVATLAFFTIVPYAAAVLVPIWKAAITDPDSVMRG
jgi:ABC-type lipoprotein release transport system permease subunit